MPFACGFALGQFLPDVASCRIGEQRLVTSLFLGTALSISSVKIVAMVVREMNFMRRNVGQIIVASAIIDDTIGWVIIAITFGIASARHARSASSLAQDRARASRCSWRSASPSAGALVFTLIRWANDNLRQRISRHHHDPA